MTKELNIFQRLLAVEAELATVAKNLTVSTGGNNSYKAVSERDIIDSVKPLEEKYGIYSYPISREVLESHLLESESTYNGKTTKKTTFMTRIRTTYRFVNVDEPSQFVETDVFSEGIDAQDKGSGKAMTYGDKYALMKMYKISTGDDPDAEASKEVYYGNASRGSKPKPTKTYNPNEDLARSKKKELVDLTSAYGINLTDFCKEHKIGNNSTVEEIQTGIDYIRNSYGSEV